MIAFRVDANNEVGFGHLMRCISIAKALESKSEKILFCSNEECVRERVEKDGYQCFLLEKKGNEMVEELPQLKRFIVETRVEKLIVDSYKATKEYLEMLNTYTDVIYIDDLFKDFYEVKMIISYGLMEIPGYIHNKYKSSSVKILKGIQYVPLREEFYPSEGSEGENKILIATGGTDPYNLSLKILEYLIDHNSCQNIYVVICGKWNAFRDELDSFASKTENVVIVHDVDNMGELMRHSCLAISAGGTTIYELCACQVPTICFSFADNQKKYNELLAQNKIVTYVGDVRDNVNILEDICNCCHKFLKDSELRDFFKQNMKQYVDGKGAKRIAEEIMK